MVAKHSVGWRIQSLRMERDVSQLELAAALDVSTSALRKIEYSQTLPSLKTLEKLSDFFKVSIDYLVRGVDSDSGNLDLYRETGLNDMAVAYLKKQKDNADNSSCGDDFIALLNTLLFSLGFYNLIWRLRRLNDELLQIEKEMQRCKEANTQQDELLREMQLENELKPLLERQEFLKWLYFKEVQRIYNELILKGDD